MILCHQGISKLENPQFDNSSHANLFCLIVRGASKKFFRLTEDIVKDAEKLSSMLPFVFGAEISCCLPGLVFGIKICCGELLLVIVADACCW